MFKILLLLSMAAAFFSVFSRPFLAPIGYQLISYMQAQAIWFWVFDGIPAFKVFAGLSIISWCVAAARKQIDFNVYKYKQNLLLLLFLLILYVSDWLSPYPSYVGLRADLIQSIVFTILLMYFVSIGLCNNKAALKLQVAIIIITTLYFTYWANSAYLNSEWNKFFQGRLRGLTGSQYKDGNLMSILYVMGMPFLLFLYKYIPHKYYRYAPLIPLPLLWHAVFLHSSRGAFLSLACCTLLSAYWMKAKIINVGIVFGLVGFLFTQGGTLIDRSEETVSASSGGDVYGSEAPINPRLVSWEVGFEIAKEYPILGAGTQRFLTASNDLFPGKSPHVAHNTLVSYAANLGFPAAIIHLSLLYIAFNYRRKIYALRSSETDVLHLYIADASTVALAGYAICSIFLDLPMFEPFYFLLSVMLVNYHVLMKSVPDNVIEKSKLRPARRLKNV